MEEYQRVGMNLVAALDTAREYAAGEAASPQEIERNVEAANDAALTQLESLMKGVM